ncbi:MAG: serine O-acetyltransferase [Acidobacteria bacterium]|nr:serine O-acetyltransferase [Acidobacteriota bacterium]
MFARVREDLATALRRDPAARSRLEIFLSYPGVHALWYHRVAHSWWNRGARLPARMLSNLARRRTGIEIHPGAVIGRRVFIDHGMGVVIGQTAIVGDDVVLYHGVTLGGVSSKPGRRHPTIGDRVSIGTGASVLGPITIGADSLIGAAAVVLKAAPPDSLIVGAPATVRPRKKKGSAAAEAGTQPEEWFFEI